VDFVPDVIPVAGWADAPAYMVKDITFSYGERRALDLVEIEIPAGELAALIGPNGSGKTAPSCLY
jgi:ABC-type Mn2+/Zn2+ transport system ATPase subunit